MIEINVHITRLNFQKLLGARIKEFFFKDASINREIRIGKTRNELPSWKFKRLFDRCGNLLRFLEIFESGRVVKSRLKDSQGSSIVIAQSLLFPIAFDSWFRRTHTWPRRRDFNQPCSNWIAAKVAPRAFCAKRSGKWKARRAGYNFAPADRFDFY